MADFESLKVNVLGVSPDSVASHIKFKQKHNLSVRLLSDPGHEMIEDYGAWGSKKMYGKETFGVIRSMYSLMPGGLSGSCGPGQNLPAMRRRCWRRSSSCNTHMAERSLKINTAQSGTGTENLN